MNDIDITIEYKLIDSSEWQSIKFLPDRYFDLEPDEKVGWDCIPFHNHAIDYLDIELNLVHYTKITVIDLEANITNITTEAFWNEGKNTILTEEVIGSISWYETIISIAINDCPVTYELLRYKKKNNLSILSYHGLIIDNEDGSQSEGIIYTN